MKTWRLLIMYSRLGACSDQSPIDDADVDCDEKNHEEIIEKSEEAEHSLREDVERRDEVEEREQTTEENSKAKHPDKTT